MDRRKRGAAREHKMTKTTEMRSRAFEGGFMSESREKDAQVQRSGQKAEDGAWRVGRIEPGKTPDWLRTKFGVAAIRAITQALRVVSVIREIRLYKIVFTKLHSTGCIAYQKPSRSVEGAVEGSIAHEYKSMRSAVAG